MSLTPQEQISIEPHRRYDAEADRLFLVYYPIIAGFNGNKWGVTESSIERNIRSAINKPVVIYKKNPDNLIHTKQAGAYIHPTPEEAATELGHFPSAEEYYNWQERFAIGRVRTIDKRDKGYAFTLEITDPDSKQILRSPDYQSSAPGFTSPQILSNAGLYPGEEQSGIYDHWGISHIALVDIPAYGVKQAGIRAKCLGAEKECMIQTRSASQENLGFCVKQATIDLINSRSSHVDSQSTSTHNIMSQSENTSQPNKATGAETVTYTGTDNTETYLPSQAQPQSQQQQQSIAPLREDKQQQQEEQQQNKEQQQLQSVKTLDEANAQIRQMSELLKEQTKQLKTQQKELDLIKTERKQARLSFIIPRELFKSDESHQKEVQKFMNENISEQWLAEYWKTKKELALATSNKRTVEEPITVKSASLSQQQNNGHDVPNYDSSQSQNVRSNIQKQLELQRMILNGGTS